MKLFKTILFAFTAILGTGFLISAFILLFYFVADSPHQKVNRKLMDTTAVITDASVKFLRKTNSDLGLPPVLVKNNIQQFFKK